MRPAAVVRALAALSLLSVAVGGAVALGPVADAAGEVCVPTTAQPTVILTDRTVALGDEVAFRGTGWCHPTDGGSRIAVKLDQGAYSRPDASVHANRTIWAIVDAQGADGTFTGSFRLPDGRAATSSPVLTTGTHSLQLLSGSLKPGDTVRSVTSADLTVVSAGTTTPDPPSWPHVQVASGTAVAWVEDELPAGDGGTLRLEGFGWTHPAGGGSTIAVKLSSSPDGDQYRRTGAAVLEGDPTIWALLRPAEGAFATAVDLPDGLVGGQYLTVSLASGKFESGDAQRTVTTPPLVVGGRPWEGDDGGSEVVCTPTSSRPTVRLASDRASYGDVLRITGTGWCNPAGGGSRIGVKIDEGAISHVDSAVHANRSIWAIVEARDADGTFTAELRLPDGTTATSAPALARGEHTLRLLSGTLAAGDTVRTLESEPFVVGRYQPNGTPDPLDASVLTGRTRHDVRATVADGRLVVRVPDEAVGTWAYVSVYAADGSPRYPWERWWRLGAGRRLDLPLAGRGLIGPGRVVVQSGESGHVGELLGWDGATFGSPTDPATDGTDGTGTGGADNAGSPTSAPPALPPVVPPVVTPPFTTPVPTLAPPGAPVASFADLDPAAMGSVTGRLADGVVTLRVGDADPGDSVFVHVYAAGLVQPAGWVVLDADRSVAVDVGAFGAGYLALTVQDPAGALLGWAPVALPAAADAAEATVAAPAAIPTAPVAAATASAGSPTWLGPTDGLLLATGALMLAAAAFLVGGRRPGGAA